LSASLEIIRSGQYLAGSSADYFPGKITFSIFYLLKLFYSQIPFITLIMKRQFTCILVLIFTSLTSFCRVTLPRLVRDSMILQRETGIRIWGWADAGEKLSIQFNNKNFRTTTAANGKWSLVLPAMKAGGPFTMHINASNRIILKDILIGDVWFCSGQSNMVHQMILHRERYEQEIRDANFPEIRHFAIATSANLQEPQPDLPGGYWKSANPSDVLQFSAVAYFFAKSIYEKYRVPIGIINASVGGTPIEAWTSEAGLKAFPAINSIIQKNKDSAYVNGTNRRAFARNQARPKTQDIGMSETEKWYHASYVPKGWHTITIPGYWEDQGVKGLDGAVWYRKEINVPASMTGIPAKVALGRIIDADYLYVNGVLAGNTTYQYPQRRYALPAGLLKEGRNVFVIRVINQGGKGGFVPDKPYYLAAGADTIDLKGDWQYKVGDVFLPQQGPPMAGIAQQNQPAALFNAMVAPVVGYAIKGILWYQGESNVGNAAEYQALLPTLIKDWRAQWKQGDLPFLYVQLPNFQEVQYLPSESEWAVLREAQLKALSVNNTGMAVAIDLGEWNDIHPDNKKDVGIRLALVAKQVAYGEKGIVSSGPLYKSSVIDRNKIILSFLHEGGGLTTNDGQAPRWFAIAGKDKKFTWAQTKIEGNNIVVWSDEVPEPAYVRYAWADNPRDVNLYNKEGLPASPFRTDAP